MESWTRVVLTVALCFLPVIVSARPASERFANENTAGAQNAVLSFEKPGENDIAGQMNEELLGAIKERHKRLSDQRRAELETLMALSKMTERLVTVGRGGRQLDLTKVGRRKRAVFDLNIKNLRKLFRLSGALGYKGNAAYPVIS